MCFGLYVADLVALSLAMSIACGITIKYVSASTVSDIAVGERVLRVGRKSGQRAGGEFSPLDRE